MNAKLKALNEQLKQLQDAAKDECARKCNAAIKEVFSQENNPYRLGQIFTDHIGRIRIKSVGLSRLYNNKVSYNYMGVILNKDLTPRKDGKTRIASLTNEVLE